MIRSLTRALALAGLALAAHAAAADDAKDKDKPAVWVRETNGIVLEFEFAKDTAKYRVSAGDADGCVVTAKVKIDKDKVTSEVTGVEVKGNFPGAPKKGDKMSFKWVVKDDTATLSDFKGEDEGAKDIVEGEYKKKKAKK